MAAARPLVAVIDDDPAFRSLIQDFLNEEGYETTAGDDAEDAFALVATVRPAVVILDMRMQEPESGKHILDQIRRAPETAQTAVIVSTADVMFLQNNEAFLREQGAFVLPKPFDLDELLELVKRAIDQQPGDTLHGPDRDGPCS